MGYSVLGGCDFCAYISHYERFATLVALIPGFCTDAGHHSQSISTFWGVDISLLYTIIRAEINLVITDTPNLWGDIRVHPVIFNLVERVDPGQPFTIATSYPQCLAPHPGRLDAAIIYALWRACVCIMLAFDEYQHEELWKFMAWVCLALGAWLYLRAKRQKQRILALIGGASGAMWIVALSKWMLIPLQKWPMGYPVSPSETTRLVETGSTMIGWVWILLMLIAPVLLNLLPPSPPPNIQEDMAPA